MIVQTDGYEFDFTNAINAFKFDETNSLVPTFHGVPMKAVDVVAEMAEAYIFVEIKNYDKIEEFSKNTDAYKWLKNYLKYKYRDSFLYRFAEDKIDKPIHYICLLNFDNALNNKMKNDLKRELPVGKKSSRWKKELAKSCQVLNLEKWNESFPKWPASKI